MKSWNGQPIQLEIKIKRFLNIFSRQLLKDIPRKMSNNHGGALKPSMKNAQSAQDPTTKNNKTHCQTSTLEYLHVQTCTRSVVIHFLQTLQRVTLW